MLRGESTQVEGAAVFTAGPPQLMEAFTDDGQVCDELVWERDARYGIDCLQRAKSRQVLTADECSFQQQASMQPGGCRPGEPATLCLSDAACSGTPCLADRGIQFLLATSNSILSWTPRAAAQHATQKCDCMMQLHTCMRIGNGSK